ncbi:MAG: squalene/phytoene synthase family protein [Sphingomicrobium sp.]
MGPDRALMLLHFPRAVQPAIAALWAIDEALTGVVAGASQPALAGIKLAWWREALVRLDHDPAPPEPRLRAVAETLLPLGVRGADVADLATGWSALLDERPEGVAASAAGAALFALQARLLGVDDPLLKPAGALAFLTNAMRRNLGDFPTERTALLAQLRGRRVSRRARPITLAARLAARDLVEPEGTPGRAVALIAHRLTGIITGSD